MHVTTSKKGRTSTELVPAFASGEPVEADLGVIASQLLEQARADGIALTGEGGLLPALVALVLEAGLAVELTEHLGYERHAVEVMALAEVPQVCSSKFPTCEV